MTDSQKLLADYVTNGSEAAFRELAARYLDLVYSTAVRLAGGDTHLAEDVAQTVFVDLAHLAKNLSSEVKLGGWLHRHTCFVAAKTLRGERRRQFRERQAAEMNALPDHSEARLAKENRSLSGSNQFEIIYQGSLDNLQGLPSESVAVVREQQPWPGPDGKMTRLYGMMGGIRQMVASDDNFQSWEAKHVISPPPVNQSGQ